MTLYQITNFLKEIALSSPYIRTAAEGSVYTILNGNPHSKYGVFVISQTIHRQDDIWDYYGFNMFVIDRLVDDLETNRLQIQSVAKEVLANTILTFITRFYGVTHNELQFHPFTEKFVDLCAGQYVQVTFQVPKSLICPDEYALDYKPEYTLQPLVVEITENGVFEYEPTGFDGYNKVTVTVNVDIPDNFEEGFESGVTYQKSLLSAITIYENGEYITDENGVSAITVDVSGYTQDDLDAAFQSGITYQKSLLSAITITHNGDYINENGYSAITVNVPQSGETINNQVKIIEISGNGNYTVTYDEGYTGLETVIINVNVSGDTPTPPEPSGETDYTKECLTFEMLTSGEVKFVYNYFYHNAYEGSDAKRTIQYRKNKGEWQSITSFDYYRENGTTIQVEAGDKLEFKGNNKRYANHIGVSDDRYQNIFKVSGYYNISGNIMSLLYGDNFSGQTVIESAYTFCYMFFDEQKLLSVENLKLPATTLTNGCYSAMFTDCRNLTGKAAELPATYLVANCYRTMYIQTKINYMKCLAMYGINTNDSTYGLIADSMSPNPTDGTFIKKSGSVWPTGSNGIPTGWTVIEE